MISNTFRTDLEANACFIVKETVSLESDSDKFAEKDEFFSTLNKLLFISSVFCRKVLTNGFSEFIIFAYSKVFY